MGSLTRAIVVALAASTAIASSTDPSTKVDLTVDQSLATDSTTISTSGSVTTGATTSSSQPAAPSSSFVRHPVGPKPSAVATQVEIPLRNKENSLVGQFGFGDSNLTLVIDTRSACSSLKDHTWDPTVYWRGLSWSKDITPVWGLPISCIPQGSLALKSDIVTIESLTAINQSFTINPTSTVYDVRSGMPAEGSIGLVGLEGGDVFGSPKFLQNLYKLGQLKDYKFGIALDTSGNGTLILGGTEDQYADGDLKYFPISEGEDIFWSVTVDVLVEGSVANNCTRQHIRIVSSRSEIWDPWLKVAEIFNELGLQQTTVTTGQCDDLLLAYYDCNTPPDISFQFGTPSVEFSINTTAIEKSSDGKCVVPLKGYKPYDYLGTGLVWYVGLPYLRGKYVDFDAANKQIGFASVKGNFAGSPSRSSSAIVGSLHASPSTSISSTKNKPDASSSNGAVTGAGKVMTGDKATNNPSATKNTDGSSKAAKNIEGSSKAAKNTDAAGPHSDSSTKKS